MGPPSETLWTDREATHLESLFSSGLGHGREFPTRVLLWFFGFDARQMLKLVSHTARRTQAVFGGNVIGQGTRRKMELGHIRASGKTQLSFRAEVLLWLLYRRLTG